MMQSVARTIHEISLGYGDKVIEVVSHCDEDNVNGGSDHTRTTVEVWTRRTGWRLAMTIPQTDDVDSVQQAIGYAKCMADMNG